MAPSGARLNTPQAFPQQQQQQLPPLAHITAASSPLMVPSPPAHGNGWSGEARQQQQQQQRGSSPTSPLMLTNASAVNPMWSSSAAATLGTLVGTHPASGGNAEGSAANGNAVGPRRGSPLLSSAAATAGDRFVATNNAAVPLPSSSHPRRSASSGGFAAAVEAGDASNIGSTTAAAAAAQPLQTTLTPTPIGYLYRRGISDAFVPSQTHYHHPKAPAVASLSSASSAGRGGGGAQRRTDEFSQTARGHPMFGTRLSTSAEGSAASALLQPSVQTISPRRPSSHHHLVPIHTSSLAATASASAAVPQRFAGPAPRPPTSPR